MSEGTVVVGIDGGGTKTHAVVVDLKGRVLAEASGPSSNFQVLGPEKMAGVVRGVVQEAMSRLPHGSAKIRRVVAGLAGVGRPSDRQRANEALTSLGLAEAVRVDSDAAAALSGAFAGGEGIILIAGTGTICFGKGADGRVERSGGWGYLLGDEGSGYWIGQQAIVAALKDLDGRGPRTALRERIEERYGLERIDLIIPRVYQGDIDRTEVASLAPLVFEEAARGDEAAEQILSRAGEELGLLAAAVARRLRWSVEQVPIALIGGIFKQKERLIPFMQRSLERFQVRFRFVEPLFDPAVGAAIMALQDEGIAVDDRIRETLRETAKAGGSR